MSTAPSLDVLLYAQQLAQERGNVFDIESFLTPSQRIQYYATVLHRSPPRAPPPPLPQVTVPSTPVSAKRPIDEEAATPGSVMDENAATLVGTPVSTKRAKLPGLAGLHWKKRQKKMAELARLEAEGIKVDPESLLSPPPETPQAAQNGTTVDGKKRGEVDKDSVQGSASYWCVNMVTFSVYLGCLPCSPRRAQLIVGTTCLSPRGKTVDLNGTTIRNPTTLTGRRLSTTHTGRSLEQISQRSSLCRPPRRALSVQG